ncbi:hypothetical protein [Streptomyces sp. LUP47B]|uniref:hypothetical protein n=1 Tax=Streptomyces sp. LUP47B TaxID=1890286 RepID=UPI000851ADA1|nr:hypothetical protein [Streptomyces sp. LUP47B]
MTISHERGAHAVLDRILTLEPTAAALVRTRNRLASGTHFTPGFVAAVGQIHRLKPGRWPVHQVAAFLDIHAEVGAGRYAMVQIEVGAVPRPDAARAANAAALADLPDPFTTQLDSNQNAADEDGTVAWTEDIVVTRSTGVPYTAGCAAPESLTIPTVLRAFCVPLEVGTTMPSRTLLHLEEDGGVARWAYDSTDLYILLNLRHPLVA